MRAGAATAAARVQPGQSVCTDVELRVIVLQATSRASLLSRGAPVQSGPLQCAVRCDGWRGVP